MPGHEFKSAQTSSEHASLLAMYLADAVANSCELTVVSCQGDTHSTLGPWRCLLAVVIEHAFLRPQFLLKYEQAAHSWQAVPDIHLYTAIGLCSQTSCLIPTIYNTVQVFRKP